MSGRHVAHIEIGLHAAVIAVDQAEALVLTVDADGGLPALPFGPFDPERDGKLEAGLRRWVTAQTRLDLGYVEQLYTFGDYGRRSGAENANRHFVSVGYLALVRLAAGQDRAPRNWNDWYRHFPWEDWRDGEPALLRKHVLPALRDWAEDSQADARVASARRARVNVAFSGIADSEETGIWDDERVLERYELMYEAGLVQEAVTDGQAAPLPIMAHSGSPMLHDHRRILATAIARLRSKLKYRPVVFELMPERFTLTELQRCVETLSGRLLHKQNFRRLVDASQLVEPTGETASQTGGRPAAIYRFKRAILRERPAPGLRIGGAR